MRCKIKSGKYKYWWWLVDNEGNVIRRFSKKAHTLREVNLWRAGYERGLNGKTP